MALVVREEGEGRVETTEDRGREGRRDVARGERRSAIGYVTAIALV
jgi:hypothetical protein